MQQNNPPLTLNNDVKMPAIGLGVYQSGPQETVEAVQTALTLGYGLIDTAAAYGNEEQVGEAIRTCDVDRSEVFVTTKLWITDYGCDQALRAFDASQHKLGLDHIDLYLLHWPVPSDFEATVVSYKAAEKLLADGRVRAIGVSNFSPKHLDDLIARTDVVPAVNQVELHPFFVQAELREANQLRGIVTQAWSPIGGVNRYRSKRTDNAKDPLTQPVITELAEKHGKTAAQVILRWQLQLGNSAIPKSVHANRIEENLDIFDFELTAGEVASLDALDTGKRGGPDPEEVDVAWIRSLSDSNSDN